MKTITLILAIILTTNSYAQMGKVEELGFRHIKTTFRGDTIDILLKSKRGHEWINKPLLLFCQGSLPKPLIIKDGQTSYGVFPFNPDSLENYYHIAIISKPYVPIIADVKSLSQNFTYLDPITGKFPLQYSQKNHLDYYVDRNIQVIEYLQRQKYIAKSKLIVAGHSEGSTIAAKIATKTNKVTHLIYCSGNPFGRITTVIAQNRAIETDTDSTRYGEDQFEHWKYIVRNNENIEDTYGDSFKATYSFSIPPIEYLNKLTIPVLICYGTKDWNVGFNDYFRVEMIRRKRENFTFNAYIGLEHNFFGYSTDGQIDYNNFNWDSVVNDWIKWTIDK